ncbi:MULTISPECIES: hypothetical protein [Staphylococcaceae]|nr:MULTISPECIES: hypothetical protein [Staphylococcaceae]HDT6904937.1 hypothetical protein [Staphylococcus aureus]HDT6905007.1 hypothetical protein [Staphylococcus aureus]HEE1480706.1 hypothetical protein [Staphylococcus aureus]HEE1480842.1 hypothetical protein [Staphylococcus aureus]
MPVGTSIYDILDIAIPACVQKLVFIIDFYMYLSSFTQSKHACFAWTDIPSTIILKREGLYDVKIKNSYWGDFMKKILELFLPMSISGRLTRRDGEYIRLLDAFIILLKLFALSVLTLLNIVN